MSELYTSLTQLKMAMNGGVLPPMTPLSERAAKVLDPDFTIGMGALMEDAQKGLRCPVRGCGAWCQNLASHIGNKHKDIRGVRGVRALLDIPSNVVLMTTAERERFRSIALASPQCFKVGDPRTSANRKRYDLTTVEASVRRARGCKSRYQSVSGRNLRNACEAQLKHTLADLTNRLGRSPTAREFASERSPNILRTIRTLYGSWESALTHFGWQLGPHRKARHRTSRPEKLDSAALLETLGAYYSVNGRLPSHNDARYCTRLPLLHRPERYMRALKTNSWPEAMRRAASLLNIYGGRYGLPEKPSTEKPHAA